MPDVPRRIPRIGWAIAFLVVTTLMAMAWVNLKGVKPPQTPALDVVAKVPDFSFTSQTGETVTREDLLGNIWIADFIFTRCPNPCPIMSERMQELQEAIKKKGGKVRLVTVTVDPEHDTPEVLAAYGKRYEADPAIWKLLTGEPEAIREFVTRGMLQPLARDQADVPVHSQRFLVVDSDGMLRSYHDLADPELLPKLLMDIGTLMREVKPRPTPANPS
jgi:protein SCO1/2